jgi:hypothetical protein
MLKEGLGHGADRLNRVAADERETIPREINSCPKTFAYAA